MSFVAFSPSCAVFSLDSGMAFSCHVSFASLSLSLFKKCILFNHIRAYWFHWFFRKSGRHPLSKTFPFRWEIVVKYFTGTRPFTKIYLRIFIINSICHAPMWKALFHRVVLQAVSKLYVRSHRRVSAQEWHPPVRACADATEERRSVLEVETTIFWRQRGWMRIWQRRWDGSDSSGLWMSVSFAMGMTGKRPGSMGGEDKEIRSK